jgi:hypothetical protein
MPGNLSGMGRERFSVLLGVAAIGATLALSGSAAAAPNCGQQVIADWRDGRLDGTYPVSCYRQALGELPEDVRVYSSAQSDITRALQTRVQAQAAKSADTGHGGGGVSPLVVVAITAALLVAAGSVAAALR